MKIAICSNKDERRTIKQWLRMYAETEHVAITVFQRMEQLLAAYQQQVYYDLIFLAWPEKLELIRQLRQKDGDALLVLLADVQQDLLPAFEMGVLTCLQRPLKESAVASVYGRCRELFLQRNQEFALTVCNTDGQKEERIFATREILYIESRLRKVYIHTIDQQQYACYGRISVLEQSLQTSGFFRAHKSCLVNLRYICYIGVDKIGLVSSGGHPVVSLPLSRRKRDMLKEAVQIR